MDRNFMHGLDIIKDMQREVNKILSVADCKGMENNEASIALEMLLDTLDNARNTIEYYTKPIREGKLKMNRAGKFDFIYATGEFSLSCGNPLEINIDNIYYAGRVEHTTDKGYYFYCDDLDNPKLINGMIARVRIWWKIILRSNLKNYL